VADSFRVGCIGSLGKAEMRSALEAMRATLAEMGVSDCRPASPAALAPATAVSARAGS
jgi:2-aminoethylphosphonate-pyruvate transaminase